MRCLLLSTAIAVLVACGGSDADSGSDPSSPSNVVENHPGSLVLKSPARAAFIESQGGAGVEVLGTGGSASTTVNGQPVKLDADGTFHATIKADVGLNLVTVADGSARLESPFVYGHFVDPKTPVAKAITVGIGSDGFSAPEPVASVTSVLNRALRDKNLVSSLAGQKFSGDVAGVTWSYDVTGGHNDATKVAIATAANGLAIDATGNGIVVEGDLKIGNSGKHFTRIIVDRARIKGTAALAVTDGVLGASMSGASVAFDGFHWDSGDFGWPCCIDTIATKFLRSKIEDAVRDGIQTQVPEAAKITLDGVGLPKELDLSAIGLESPVAVSAKLDDAVFDANGAAISAAVLFGGTFPAGSPGSKAPGFLPLGGQTSSLFRPGVLGASFSVDTVNQLFFATWGSGELSFATPPSLGLTLTPKLPPMVSVTPKGAVRVAIGELVVQMANRPEPVAAVTILQDVVPSADATSLLLTADGEPTISVTFLADSSVQNGNGLIAGAAKDQVKKLLSPFRVPLPTFALDKLGAKFEGESLALTAVKFAVDSAAGRVGAEGTITLVQPKQ